MDKETLSPADPGRVLPLLPPFPVGLVTTRTNVITIGQIEYFTLKPLRIGIAVAHTRHTYPLLKAEGEFVLNVPDAGLTEALKICGSLSGRDQDKFKAARLTLEPSMSVRAVSLREAGACVECRVEREIEFEDRTWFIGRVVYARRRPGFTGAGALLCNRTEYRLPGKSVAPR